MTQKLVRVLLCATALTVPIVTSANEVANPGFETTPDLSWTFGAGASILGSHAQTDTYAAYSACSGVGCLGTNASGVTGTATFYQDLTLAPGIYQLSYSVRVDTTTPTYAVASSLGTNVTTLRTNFGATANVYQEFVDYSAVAGGSTRLAFAMRHDPSAMHIDDIELIMVDDGQGNNIAAVTQANAFQNTYGFLDRLQNRFGHAGSPVKVALNSPVTVADNSGGYISPNGKYRAYMGGYGDRSKWDSGDVQSRRWGLTAGAEMAVSDGLDLGFAVAAGHSRFSSDTLFTDNRGIADEYSGALYGHFSPSSVPIYVTAAAGYGYSSNDLSRTSTMALGTVVARNVEATQWFGSVELGYDWALSNTFILTPYARADGARLDQDGYTETVLSGGLIVPMTVLPVDQDAARTILGARGTFDLNVGRRGAKLTANAGWAHEFETDRAVGFTTTSSSLGSGTPVTFAGVATGATPDANSVVAGANVEAPISNEARIFVGYNGNFASGQDSHAGEVGLRVVW